MNNEWWGKNFIIEQRKVYGSQTRFFVPFISTEYFAKPIPADEFQAAMMTAVKQEDPYILPVLIGDVRIPPELMHPHRRYLRADDYTPAELAREMQRRLGSVTRADQPTREITEVVQEALELRMPKVVPLTFSKYKELQTVFDYLGNQFEMAVRQLSTLGFVGNVERLERQLVIRIERSGKTVYALDVYRGSSMGGDDALEFRLDAHRAGSSGINAWATVLFDAEAGVGKLELMDFSLLQAFGGQTAPMTKEEFFTALWERIVTRLEGRA
jgi:hypothetical protein